jgi:hypothetical protein
MAMTTPEGRAGLALLLERIGPLATVYDHSGSSMYYNEGRRSVALEIMDLLEQASPVLYDQLDQEMRHRRRAMVAEAGAVHLKDRE